MALLLIIVALILAIPFLLLFGFSYVVANSFESFGLPGWVTLAVFAGMLIGSLINIPVGRHRLVEVEQVKFFGLVRKRRMLHQGLSINVGGALIPMGLSAYLLLRVPLQETALAIVLMTIICYFLARVIPGKGIVIPMFFPALFATLFALILAHDVATPVAFISGVLGVLIGGDILHLPKVIRENQGVMSIGGAGVFDGIFLVAVIAAFLAGL